MTNFIGRWLVSDTEAEKYASYFFPLGIEIIILT